MKGIYKLHFKSRSGSLYGMFIETKERVDKLISSGIYVYFGEVLGKHSEVYGDVEDVDISLCTNNEVNIEMVENNNLLFGYNPFKYTSIEFDFEANGMTEEHEEATISEIIDILITNDSNQN